MSDNSNAGQGTLRVAVVGGDGIGTEVIEQGLRVIEAAGVSLETQDYDLAAAATSKTARCYPIRYSKSGVVSMPSTWGPSVRQGFRQG